MYFHKSILISIKIHLFSFKGYHALDDKAPINKQNPNMEILTMDPSILLRLYSYRLLQLEPLNRM